MRRPAEGVGPVGTRALLDAIATGDQDATVPLGEVFGGLGDRAFGMLLIVAAAPGFIPIPGVAGALSGPLVVLVGLQLALRLRRPWLPAALARRGPRRSALARFRNALSPLLSRLERLVRPRMTWLLDHWAPQLVTGLLVLAVGLLLWLPIPFTNYVFALLAVLFALAFLERDGALMLVAWLATGASVVIFGALADTAILAVASRWR